VVETKRCTACKVDQPLDADHWYWKTKNGVRYVNGARCKGCVKAAQKDAPRTPRSDAQRDRENAAKRNKRASANPRPVLARSYAEPMSTPDARRIQARREEAREADPEGFAEKRRREMAEYRRKKRVAALVDVVTYVRACLDLGQTPEQVAETLEARGVRAGKTLAGDD
jgi:hypothetical protein